MSEEKKKPKKQPPLKVFQLRNYTLRVYPNPKSGKLFSLSKFYKTKQGIKTMSLMFMPREIPVILELLEQYHQWNLEQKGVEGASPEPSNEEPEVQEVNDNDQLG